MPGFSDVHFGLTEEGIAADSVLGSAARSVFRSLETIGRNNPVHAATEARRMSQMLSKFADSLEKGPDTAPPQSHQGSQGSNKQDGPSLYGTIEKHVLEFLAAQPDGLTIEDFVELFELSNIEIKRPTLLVYMRRMTNAELVKTKTRGQYVLAK